MSVKLLTKHTLEFLSLKGGFKGSSESTLVKMPLCWKPHVKAQLFSFDLAYFILFTNTCPLLCDKIIFMDVLHFVCC